MIQTMRNMLDKNLTYTEMRIVLAIALNDKEGGEPLSNIEISDNLELDHSRARTVCKTLVDEELIKATRKGKKNYYTLVEDIRSKNILKEPESIKDTEGSDIVEMDTDDLVVYHQKTDWNAKSMLQRALNRRVQMMAEDDRDPIQMLKEAKEKRKDVTPEEEYQYHLLNNISPENQLLCDKMRNHFKRLEDESNEVCAFLYALKKYYPDVSGQMVGAAGKGLKKQIDLFIKQCGWDFVFQMIQGRQIRFNGSNFTEYWTRQIKKQIIINRERT